jgi:Mn-dependent DtxR family transcriptional regulator
MKIYESAENYLEAILVLGKSEGQVRSVDIAKQLGFSKPSVSIAMKQLKENGYIQIEGGGKITLTETGLEIAERIYERHTLLARALMSLGVDEATAKEDACRIEHDLSGDSFEKLKKYIKEHLK